MTQLAVLGATGNLGRRVAALAIERGHSVSAAVRTRHKLDLVIAASAKVSEIDLLQASLDTLAHFIEGHDALICCAGQVTDGEAFVTLVDKVVTAAESLPQEQRPVCWFLAGAALLTLDARGRRGVDLPKVRDVYWPHDLNFQRLQRSTLDWRLLCPGPMVDQPPLGTERLRIAVDALACPMPGWVRHLPPPLLLPWFALKVPEMIISYDDAAVFMLSHLEAGDALSRHRVGLALPAGMRGRKDQWTARK